MKVFLIQRTDEVDYDEYDSCVIVAESEEQALHIAENVSKQRYDDDIVFSYYGGNHEVTEIDLTADKTGIICSSYNAG